MDSALRRRQRAGVASPRDLVRLGRWRELSAAELIAEGLVSGDRLALAREVVGSDWAIWGVRLALVERTAKLLGETLPARLATDYAARVPQGAEGRAAIEAARAWADDPTEGRRAQAAYATLATAADYAAYAASAVDYAANAADYAANAADYAALAAAWAGACHAAAVAAGYAARAAADLVREQEWQRERLALYLAAPEWPEPVEEPGGRLRCS